MILHLRRYPNYFRDPVILIYRSNGQIPIYI